MTQKQYPIYDTSRYSIAELNRIFVEFDAAFLGVKGRLGTFQGVPDYIANSMGEGVLPSLTTEEALRQRKDRKSPTRVGKAINYYHNEMRSTAKRWGTYLAKDVQVRFIPPLTKEEHEVLHYLQNYDDESKITSVPSLIKDSPYVDLPSMVEKIFDKVEKITLQPPDGPPLTLPNIRLNKCDGDSSVDDGAGAHKYSVCIASMVWGLREAGMSIKGRPEASPFRDFLMHVIGTERGAGETMVQLHEWAPTVFKDYNRKNIADAIEDQKYWIKLAYGISSILEISDKSRKGFADALKLVGEDPEKLNIKSADKVGILLYTLSERLASMETRITSQVKDADGKLDGAVKIQMKRRLEEKQQGLTLAETIAGLKELSGRLHEIGKRTESILDEAKRNDSLHRPNEDQYYRDMTEGAFALQRAHTHALFQEEPKFLKIAEAAKAFAALIKMDGVGMSESGYKYTNATLEFCRKQSTLAATSENRIDHSVSFHPCG